ncbi:uncharacterized protein [Triticum aestivum]|uniref:uncharacterized protein n=1 Tax=Triticum aestivum TaxID=4565 RepID=UPI0008452936|nr:uncharacterized protein LOC123066214 [Triticum aestivum]
MEGETPPPPELDGTEGEAQPPPACVSKVLDDENLLTEIIVRVGCPTSLVRAAGVCRLWLSHASDRAFLRRFRELHPPRLLGFYLEQREYPDAAARFFPMLPQPPGLDAVVRRASFSLDAYEGAQTDMAGCWNGSVLTSLHVYNFNHRRSEITFVVHIPALHHKSGEGNFCTFIQLFSKEEGAGVSYFYVRVECDRLQTYSTVQVYVLQNGDHVWRTHLTLASADVLLYPRSSPKGVLVGNKIYVPCDPDEIVVLDLTTSILLTIQLPQGVGFGLAGNTMLSRADDSSGVYLIHVKEFQLHIWLLNGDSWLLVDTICLREMCANFLEDEPTADIRINHVGDYNEFVFLEMCRCVLYLDIKCRTLRKVYEMTSEEQHLGDIYPFMMSWPPIFPALVDSPASEGD